MVKMFIADDKLIDKTIDYLKNYFQNKFKVDLH